MLFKPGLGEIADWMGESCSHNEGPAQQCTVWDLIDLLWLPPVLIFIGGVMALALRPESKGPVTMDFTRFRS